MLFKSSVSNQKLIVKIGLRAFWIDPNGGYFQFNVCVGGITVNKDRYVNTTLLTVIE